jgi:hypothetical protein
MMSIGLLVVGFAALARTCWRLWRQANSRELWTGREDWE